LNHRTSHRGFGKAPNPRLVVSRGYLSISVPLFLPGIAVAEVTGGWMIKIRQKD
jgi:hypothetical protein